MPLYWEPAQKGGIGHALALVPDGGKVVCAALPGGLIMTG